MTTTHDPKAPPKADFSGVRTEFDTTASRGPADAGSEPVRNGRSYTVEKGDTLSHIAKQFYGKAGAWQAIFEANRDRIDDPDLIHPGQVLRIPAEPPARGGK